MQKAWPWLALFSLCLLLFIFYEGAPASRENQQTETRYPVAAVMPLSDRALEDLVTELELPAEPLPVEALPAEKLPTEILPEPVIRAAPNIAAQEPHQNDKLTGTKIAIVIDDLGQNAQSTKAVINLPAALTLAFLPYGDHLKPMAELARQRGHEVILHMPMQPLGRDDPGPLALRAGDNEEQIANKMQVATQKIPGVNGFNNHMGSRFSVDASSMALLMQWTKRRGFYFLDSRTHADSKGMNAARAHGVPFAVRDVFLDHTINAEAIGGQLRQLQSVAVKKGSAIAIGHPHGLTVAALREWIPAMQKQGVIFVTIPELLERP
jgi:uncharacterized protein